MAVIPFPAQSGQPPQQPQPAPAPQQANPPVGSSPATQPTRNAGYEVAAQKMAGLALLILERALPLAGASGDLGRSIHQAIGSISKHVPPGAVTPADIQNQMEQLMMRQQQFGAQMQRMRAQAAQQQAQGGGAPAGASPQPQAAAAA